MHAHRKLYVLYENNEVRAYDFDGNRLDVLQGQNVLGIAAVNDMVFYSTADAPLYFKEAEPPKVPVAVPSPQKDEESSINWGRVGERALGAVAIVGGTVLIIYTLANNVTGIGVVDDAVLGYIATELFEYGSKAFA